MRTGMGGADLVGRDAPLEQVERAVGAVAAASGHALLITGEAGIGKSTLLGAVLRRADDRFRVAVEAASELETDLPFAPLVRALGLRPRSSNPDAAALGSLLAGHEQTDPKLFRLRMIEGIADLVERWALERPVLLAVEDLHWADDATLQTLDRLARRLQHVGVLIVGTARPHPRPGPLRVLERTLANVGATLIDLDPLPEEVVIELASQVLGESPGPVLTGALAQAGGNPLYVTELLAAVEAQQDGDRVADLPAPGVPDSVRLTILRNLSLLPSSTLEVLRTASVLGSRFDLRQLALTMDRPEPEVVDDLRPAFASRAVSGSGERIAFRHDLVRDAVYEDQPRAVRAATHRQIVERLRAAGLPADELVPHLLRGNWQGVPEAAGWLAEAGRALRGRSQPLATELLARAVDHAGRDAELDLRLDLADTLAAEGRGEDVEAVLEPVLSVPLTALDQPIRDRLVAFVNPVTRPTLTPAGRRAALDALEEAGLSAPGRGRAMTVRAWMHWIEGRREEAAELATRGLAIATDAGDHEGACWLELMLARIEELDDELITHARAALEHARLVPARPELVLTATATFALIAGNYATLRPEAARAVSEALALADRIGLDGHQTGLEGVAAVNAQRDGDWDDASVRFDAALESLSGDASPTVGAPGTAILYARAARLNVHRDELELAGTRVRAAQRLWSQARALGQEQEELHGVYLAEAELRIALGESDAAIDALREMAAFFEDRDMPTYHAVTLPAVTAIAWQADRPQEARAAVERAERGTDSNTTGNPNVRSLVRWCRARVDGDQATLDGLVDWADGPRPLWEWRPQIREDAAAVLSHAGQTERAVQRLEEALALWGEVGARRDVARVRKGLRELGVHRGRGVAADRPDTGWASLTEAEWRVVELVDAGLIYREIGERLFVSRRTVETHVQHVFRKLGISSRRELVDRLQSAEPDLVDARPR